jgi:hypothetical protein
LPSSSMATPSRVKPLSAYFFWKPIIQGISTWQGSHQVAQKLTTTTFPWRLARETSLPWRSWKVTSGAFGRGLFGAEGCGLAAARLAAGKGDCCGGCQEDDDHGKSQRYAHAQCSPYLENLFRNVSLPDSHVRRFRNTKPPTASSRAPLKTSTVCRWRRNF